MSDMPATAETVAAIRVNGTDFISAQAENRRNTRILIFVLILIGLALGYVIGWALEAWSADQYEIADMAEMSALGIFSALVFGGVGIVAGVVTLSSGDRIVLSLTGAKEVTNEEEPLLHNVVAEMAIAAGLPMPRVAVIETDALNAFATGMKQEHAVIGVTRGLLKTLNREQLQGVVAHEMGHVLNLDTRYMTAVGIMVGLIALVSDAALRSLRFGGRSKGSGGKKGGGAAIVLVILLLFAVIAPLAAQAVRFSVSRQREYLADATAVQLTRNPIGLIGALRILDGHTKAPEIGNRAIQHLFIVNPVRNFKSGSNALMATHPSLAERIERLTNLGKA